MKFPLIVCKIFLFTLIHFDIATATDCAIGMEFSEAISSADEFFLGRLIEIKPYRNSEKIYSGKPKPWESSYFDTELIFSIEKKWKGNRSNRISIHVDPLCPPYVESRDSTLWTPLYSQMIDLGSQIILYAYKSESRLEELIYKTTDLNFTDNDLPGHRFSSHSFNRTFINWEDSASIGFNLEITRLDSAFTQPVKLRPYYLNLKNFFFLLIIGFSAFWFWIRRKADPSEVSSG